MKRTPDKGVSPLIRLIFSAFVGVVNNNPYGGNPSFSFAEKGKSN